MAGVQFDAASNGYANNASGGAINVSHTCTQGAYLVVDLVSDREQPPSSLTWNGVGMTKVLQSSSMDWTYLGTTYHGYFSRWELANCSAATANVTVPAQTGSGWTCVMSVSYTGTCGASRHTLVDTAALASPSSTGSQTANADEMIVAALAGIQGGAQQLNWGTPSGGTNRKIEAASYSCTLFVSDSASSPTTFSSTPNKTTGTFAGAVTVLMPAITGTIAGATTKPAADITAVEEAVVASTRSVSASLTGGIYNPPQLSGLGSGDNSAAVYYAANSQRSQTVTVGVGDYVLLDLYSDRTVTWSSVKFDGNTMTLLDSYTGTCGASGNSQIARYGYRSTVSGTKTLNYTPNAIIWGQAIASAWSGVDTVVSHSHSGGTTATGSQSGTVTPGTQQLLVSVLAGTNSSSTTTAAWNAVSGGTSRYNVTNNYSCVTLADAVVDTTFSAQDTASAYVNCWLGIVTVFAPSVTGAIAATTTPPTGSLTGDVVNNVTGTVSSSTTGTTAALSGSLDLSAFDVTGTITATPTTAAGSLAGDVDLGVFTVTATIGSGTTGVSGALAGAVDLSAVNVTGTITAAATAATAGLDGTQTLPAVDATIDAATTRAAFTATGTVSTVTFTATVGAVTAIPVAQLDGDVTIPNVTAVIGSATTTPVADVSGLTGITGGITANTPLVWAVIVRETTGGGFTLTDTAAAVMTTADTAAGATLTDTAALMTLEENPA